MHSPGSSGTNKEWFTAASHGDTAILTSILEHAQDVDATDEWQETAALHLAARYGHTDTAALLLERGANLSATTNDGSTPPAPRRLLWPYRYYYLPC